MDGKLYVKAHEGAQKKWRADIPKHIAQGDKNWIKIAPYWSTAYDHVIQSLTLGR